MLMECWRLRRGELAQRPVGQSQQAAGLQPGLLQVDSPGQLRMYLAGPPPEPGQPVLGQGRTAEGPSGPMRSAQVLVKAHWRLAQPVTEAGAMAALHQEEAARRFVGLLLALRSEVGGELEHRRPAVLRAQRVR